MPSQVGPAMVTDDLRAMIREELPEAALIRDEALRAQVIEAWASAIADSSFRSIADIAPSGGPGVFVAKRGTQIDHLRGVTRIAMRMADELEELYPDLKVDRDILIAGGLCHDVGKAFEFDPERRKAWQADPHAVGLPPLRHPAYGAHICLSAGLPLAVAHVASAHSGEGELLTRSLENTIINFADHAFWHILAAGGQVLPESIPAKRP
jgi:putative nucleotidyltransferase with HDIG domain